MLWSVCCSDSGARPGHLSGQHVWGYSAAAERGRNGEDMPYFYSLNSCSFPSHKLTLLMGVFNCLPNIVCVNRIAKIPQVLITLLLTHTTFRKENKNTKVFPWVSSSSVSNECNRST